MRLWLSGPRVLGGMIRPGVSFGPEDFRQPSIPNWKRYEWRRGLIDEAKAEGRSMTREEADYLIDKSMHTILQALQEEKAKKRRRMWFWAAIVWVAVAVAFALIITAKADERLHDGAACENEWGEPGTYYGGHCYVSTDDD
jgi:hypothetical protein